MAFPTCSAIRSVGFLRIAPRLADDMAIALRYCASSGDIFLVTAMDCDCAVGASAPAPAGAIPAAAPSGAVVELFSAERLDKVHSIEFAEKNPRVIQRRRTIPTVVAGRKLV